ncbi:MAG: T9SS type A sorting domain-containing protein [Chitinophagales bacterium]
MKKAIGFIWILIFFGVFLHAKTPDFEWVYQLDNQSHHPPSITTDEAGNLYVAGSFHGTVQFGPSTITASGSPDAYVLKMDSNSNIIWVRHIVGSPVYYINATPSVYINSVGTDNQGNIIVGGDFNAKIEFFQIASLTTSGDFDGFILKLDDNGNYLWSTNFGSLNSPEYNSNKSVVMDNYGNIFATGVQESYSGKEGGFITKFNSNGDLLWDAKFISGGSTISFLRCYSIALDIHSNVYATGQFLGTADFNPDWFQQYILESDYGTSSGGSWGSTDKFIIKLDSAGNLVWAKNLKGRYDIYVQHIAVDQASNIYTVGGFEDVVDFDPGAGVFNLSTPNNIFNTYVLKCDSNGNFIWAKSFYGSDLNRPRSVALDGYDNVYLTGRFKGLLDFNTNPSQNDVLISDSTAATYISKLDSEGNLFWSLPLKVTSGSGGGVIPNSLSIGYLGEIFSSGIFSTSRNNPVDFDPGTGKYELLSTLPSYDDSYIHKMTQCFVDLSVTNKEPTLIANATGVSYQWIDCNNNSLLSGETNQSFTATINGSYAVIITGNICTDTSLCFKINSLNTNNTNDKYSSNHIELYPNPTQSNLTISTETVLHNATLSLIDIQGRRQTIKNNLSGNHFTLDLSTYAPGIYFVELLSAGKSYREKVVKH